MNLADLVWRDPATGKFTIIGTFSTIAARRFPTTHPSLAIYLALTDGRGPCRLQLRIVDASEAETLSEAEIEVQFRDPIQLIEFGVRLDNIWFPGPGEYRVQLAQGTEVLFERRLFVIGLPGDQNEEEG